MPISPSGVSTKDVAIAPRQILSPLELSPLNTRSNAKGWIQLLGHLAVLGFSGFIWSVSLNSLNLDRSLEHWAMVLPMAILAVSLYGFSFAAMFAPLHECAHRTAFANNQVNDVVSWLAGILCLYNSTFYRRYHKWHHRYAQIPGMDPELSDRKPQTWQEYLWQISGIPWWIGKLRGHSQVALGHLEDCPYISLDVRPEVIRSTRLQLLVYVGAIALSTALHHPEFLLLYWALPLAVGQPLLRAILLSEHTGCTADDNPFTNTRTTLTMAPLRWLMWNMPFHAEHHLYASIPFHALPAAHERLRSHFAHVAPGYLHVNRAIVTALGQTAP
jgi:fatty acid desaturase